MVSERLREVDSVQDLQFVVQKRFTGVLLVLLGLEILESLKIFFTEHKVRLELILIVAIIAVSRPTSSSSTSSTQKDSSSSASVRW